MSAAASRYELFALEAIDSWFFREPRPFHADESVAGGMSSLFPPPSRTVVGALRAALARANGWNGQGRWTAEITAVLGDGDDLGGLRFLGPILMRGDTAFYPLPRNVIGRRAESGWQSTAVLAPGESVMCDLGSARLPDAVGWRADDLSDSSSPDGCWGSAAALAAVLAGEPPEQKAEVVRLTELVVMEPRVGIRRERATRTAADDALYAAEHFRPRDGVRVVVGVGGLPDDCDCRRPKAGDLLPFGGEGRAAVLHPTAGPDFPGPPTEALAKSRGYSATFLTPAFLPAEAWQPGATLPGLPGKVVAACCGDPIRLGGWDTENRRPIAARSAVPAGSTWFLELGADDEHGDLLALHGQHYDPQGQGLWGYGRIAIGTWSADGTEGVTE